MLFTKVRSWPEGFNQVQKSGFKDDEIQDETRALEPLVNMAVIGALFTLRSTSYTSPRTDNELRKIELAQQRRWDM